MPLTALPGLYTVETAVATKGRVLQKKVFTIRVKRQPVAAPTGKAAREPLALPEAPPGEHTQLGSYLKIADGARFDLGTHTDLEAIAFIRNPRVHSSAGTFRLYADDQPIGIYQGSKFHLEIRDGAGTHRYVVRYEAFEPGADSYLYGVNLYR